MKLPKDEIERLLKYNGLSLTDFSFSIERNSYFGTLHSLEEKDNPIAQVKYSYNGIGNSSHRTSSVKENILIALKRTIVAVNKDNERREERRLNPPKQTQTDACEYGDWGGPCGNLHCDGGEGQDYDWSGGW